MCVDFPSTNDDITFPNADNDKLIFLASSSLVPSAFVFDCLSDPAKSTRFNFPALICCLPFSKFLAISI